MVWKRVCDASSPGRCLALRRRRPAEESRRKRLRRCAQRYFNILCLAYGSDPDYFAAAVKRGNLPDARAKGCGFEYTEANYALQKLVMPFIDEAQWEDVRLKYQGKPGTSPSPAGR